MKKVKIVRGAKDILNDRLEIEKYEDEYVVLEDMKVYKLLLNLRTNETYSFKNQYIIENI